MSRLQDLPEELSYTQLSPELREPLEAMFGDGWPELWQEVAYILYTVLLDAGLPADWTAEELAGLSVDMLRALCNELGGKNFYLAKGVHVDAKLLAQMVVQEFRGNNYTELVRKTGLSKRRIDQILDAHRKSRQKPLFE